MNYLGVMEQLRVLRRRLEGVGFHGRRGTKYQGGRSEGLMSLFLCYFRIGC